MQDYYLRLIAKDDKGRLTNRIVGTIFKNHADAHAEKCKMQECRERGGGDSIRNLPHPCLPATGKEFFRECAAAPRAGAERPAVRADCSCSPRVTLVFGIMDMINLAHGSLYMIGAYLMATIAQASGSFWVALLLALICTALIGMALEMTSPRRLPADHLSQVLATFALILIADELVRMIWARRRSLNVPPQLAGSIEIIPARRTRSSAPSSSWSAWLPRRSTGWS